MDGLKRLGELTPELERFLMQWDASEDYIIAHTSGSTGRPKEIRLMKRDMLISAKNTCKFFGLNSLSRIGLPLSVDYIAGKMMVVRALSSRSTLWIEFPSMTPLKDYKSDGQLDLFAVVPAQLDGLISSGAYLKVKTLLIGGAPLSKSMECRLLELGISAYVTYGMTETCSHVALRKIGSDIYMALDGISFSADEENRLVVECPEFSFQKVQTNDIVELIDKKSFRWRGRKDNVINSGGIKLHPEEIEKKISGILIGLEFYLTSRKSALWGEELILMIESEKEIPAISDRFRQVLSRYEIPKQIVYVKQFERTSSGKIIRQKF